MADVINNSNDDSFESRLREIREYQAGPVNSKIAGDPCKPVAMIRDFDSIAELEEGEIIGDPIFNSTSIRDPAPAGTVPEPSPVEQVDNYLLNPEELVTRLNNTQSARPRHETISLRDPGCGISFYAISSDRPETETGPSISWDGFKGNLKVITQTLQTNKRLPSANKKKIKKLHENIFQQQLEYGKVQDDNKEISANNVKLAETLIKQEKELEEVKEKLKTITRKHEVLSSEYQNCKSMMDEAAKFQINVYGGGPEIAESLQTAYEEQLHYSKLQKEELDELNQRINKLTKERQNFLKHSHARLQKLDDKYCDDFINAGDESEKCTRISKKKIAEVRELEAELEEANLLNEELYEETGLEEDQIPEIVPEEYERDMSQMREVSRALQGKIRELAVDNRTLLEKHLTLSARVGNKTRTKSTVGLPNRRPRALRMYKAYNLSFGGYDSAKPNARYAPNRTV